MYGHCSSAPYGPMSSIHFLSLNQFLGRGVAVKVAPRRPMTFLVFELCDWLICVGESTALNWIDLCYTALVFILIGIGSSPHHNNTIISQQHRASLPKHGRDCLLLLTTNGDRSRPNSLSLSLTRTLPFSRLQITPTPRLVHARDEDFTPVDESRWKNAITFIDRPGQTLVEEHSFWGVWERENGTVIAPPVPRGCE